MQHYLAGWKSVDQASKAMLEQMDQEYPRIVELVSKGKLNPKALAGYEQMLLSWQADITKQKRDLESLKVTPATRALHEHTLELLKTNSESLDQVLLMLTLCAELQGKLKKAKGKKLEGVRGELQQVLASLGHEQTDAAATTQKIDEELAGLSSTFSLNLETLQAVPPVSKPKKG